MSVAHRMLYMPMIQGDLAMAYAHIQAGRYEMALHHLQAAAEKTNELREADENTPDPVTTQIDLIP